MSRKLASGSDKATEVPYTVAMKRYEEILLPEIMMPNPSEKLEFIKHLPYKEGDVLLATYPMSGTSWLSHILIKLLKGGSDDGDRPAGRLLETAPPKVTLNLTAPRILTTHLWPPRFPTEFLQRKGKIILLLRNPKDVAVSYYCHLKRSAVFATKQTWHEFFLSFTAGHVPYGQYFDFLEEWDSVIRDSREGKNDLNVEVVYYEDLKLHGLATLKRLNEVLGTKKSDDELRKIYEACSFDKMKEKVHREREKIPARHRDKEGNSVLFRKGVVGDWKNYFTIAQDEKYNKMIAARMSDSIFSFVYSE